MKTKFSRNGFEYCPAAVVAHPQAAYAPAEKRSSQPSTAYCSAPTNSTEENRYAHNAVCLPTGPRRMKAPILIHLPPIQSLRSIYGTRYQRPGRTAAYATDAPELLQMDAPNCLPAGSTVRTSSPAGREAIIHASFIHRAT